jgi:hypothetical protein
MERERRGREVLEQSERARLKRIHPVKAALRM